MFFFSKSDVGIFPEISIKDDFGQWTRTIITKCSSLRGIVRPLVMPVPILVNEDKKMT